jgi:hypothetical protein
MCDRRGQAGENLGFGALGAGDGERPLATAVN